MVARGTRIEELIGRTLHSEVADIFELEVFAISFAQASWSKVARTISGRKTRSVFELYNIVSEDDLAAADRVTAHVATAAMTPAVVAPLGREHAQ